MVSDPFQCAPVLSKKTTSYNNSKNTVFDNDDSDYDDADGGGGDSLRSKRFRAL